MPTKNQKQTTGKTANTNTKQKKPAFVTRYLGIDSHLTNRNGSAEQVWGIASERPAGRKLAEDLAKQCTQLDAEGYEVISVFPLTSGRAVEAAVEASERVHGRTYDRTEVVEETGWFGQSVQSNKQVPYLDTGIGYSVTDGVIILAKLCK